MTWGNLPASGNVLWLKKHRERKQQMNHNVDGNMLIPRQNWRLWVHMQFQFVVMFGNLSLSMEQWTLTRCSKRSIWKHGWHKFCSIKIFLHCDRFSFCSKVVLYLILKHICWNFFKLFQIYHFYDSHVNSFPFKIIYKPPKNEVDFHL